MAPDALLDVRETDSMAEPLGKLGLAGAGTRITHPDLEQVVDRNRVLAAAAEPRQNHDLNAVGRFLKLSLVLRIE